MDLSERGEGARRHPWEVVRTEHFLGVLASGVDLPQVGQVLDIGAGDGFFAQELLGSLPSDARVVCWDVNYRSADLDAALPERVERTSERPNGAFDVVLLLDVLEHIDDDEGFLRDTVVPALRPGGTLLLSVPVHPRLYSAHDDRLEHVRRYRPTAVSTLLRRHLDVVREGSLFTSLLPARAATVALERVGRASEPTGIGAWSGGGAVTAAVTGVLRADARSATWLGRHGVVVPGLSYWALARRRG